MGTISNIGALFRGFALKELYDQSDVTGNTPRSDPQNQGAAHLLSLNDAPRLVLGTITDSCALTHAYRVQFERHVAPLVCTLALSTSHTLFGVRDLRTLQPGTLCIVIIHPRYEFGFIIGTVPPSQLATSKNTLEDMIYQGTRNRVDEGHKHPLRMDASGHIPDVHAGRPFDSTTAGEWGFITETGLRVYLDSFMAMLGNGEGCGITTFYHDDLMRIAAYNLQQWGAGYEREALNDQDECYDLEGWTSYPWEQLGLFLRADPRRQVPAEQWQIGDKQPWYSNWEPLDDNQQPWHRSRIFQGYLGQGRKEIHQTCPKIPPQRNLYYDDSKPKFIGLHDDFVTMSGERMIQSAKRISITKRCGIISPKRLARPEQPAGLGNDETNYKFAGLQGQGPEHKITSNIAADDSKPFLQRAAGILDMHAYLYNYAGFMGFYWKDKDWYTPEESELTHINGMVQAPIDFSKLADDQYLQPPEPIVWDVDHRLKDQQYWQNESGIDFLDDGGVVLYDGFGSELRMTGGHIFISAPGDIWHKAGRNVNSWAGYDLIMRAKNSADLTATEHDIRLLANGNTQVVAGAGGTGAVMIESRGTGSTYDYSQGGEQVQANGVQLKSRAADIVTWAKNIYLRTGGGNVEQGIIFLDAAKGTQSVYIQCSNQYNYVQSSIYHLFGSDGNIERANEFRQDTTHLCSEVTINGGLVVAGDISNRGWIRTAGGHITTEQADSFDRRVLPLQGAGVSAVEGLCEQAVQQAIAIVPQVGESEYHSTLVTSWYSPGCLGEDTTIRQAEGTLRNQAEYKTTSFELWEDRWQQLCRLRDGGSATWSEIEVSCECGPRMPYPGREVFTSSALCQQDLTLFNAHEGHCEDRGAQPQLADPYADPKYHAVERRSLTEYITIR